MRYFLISYVCTHKNVLSFAEVNFSCNGFPSQKQIKEIIHRNYNVTDATVINIFEFKSENDFQQFRKES